MRSSEEDELDAFMARLSRGERAAFDPVFHALHPRAVRLARVKLPEDQAADAAQTILMKVMERASDFHVGRPTLPWFYALAAGELRTFARRRLREQKRAADERHASDLPAPEDPERALLERELRAALARAMDELDDEGAEAILAMLNEGSRPDVNASAFRKRVSRAYARLRILLGALDAK